MKRIITMFIAIISILAVNAQNLSMPRFFADGMVLQRGEKIPVWGKTQAGRTVEVELNGQKAKAKAGADGVWKAWLPKMKAGGPYVLTISDGASTRTVNNVLVGDVFLCSGQSNMELPIRRCMDVVAEKVKDYSNDQIRYLKIPQQYNYVRPNDDMRVLPWQNITPQNCAEVSGICYFMARELQEKYQVPIGIINSAVGGTRVEAWMPQEVLATFDSYKNEFGKQKYHQENWPDSIRRMENAAANRWEREMTASDQIVNVWKEPGYEFPDWKEVEMFSNWSGGRNGSYWFRTTVDLPENLSGREGILRFGAMKDADSIFVNGQFVGNTTYQYPPRIYNVKGGILRGGSNDIVVHLMSQNGRPSFTPNKLYQLEVSGEVFKLSDKLQMAVGCTMPPKPSSTYFVDGNTGLYNAMIAPFRDFPFKGILWYQGESNMGNTRDYAALLGAMVESWRKQFGKTLPLVIMQLPAYMQHHEKPVDTGWTQIRHQQYMAAWQISKAALAPTLDTGEAVDIHPQDKDVAGLRAALQMQKLAYGEKTLVSSGPTPLKAVVKEGKVVITFSKESGELTAKDGVLHDFAVQTDGRYELAEATITGPYTVSLSLPAGTSTTAVRYCWDDYPHPTLFNKEGIPAPQFQIEVSL